MRHPDGWGSTDRRGDDGSVESTQRALAPRPVVPVSDGGARRLGRAYGLGVRRAGRGLVRWREDDRGVEVRLLGLRRPLLTLGPAQPSIGGDRVGCTYAIVGGLLARRPGGTLALAQSGRELEVAVTGFAPRLAVVYRLLERRLHVAVSRRFFRRLIAEAAER
jgi:hypothetical protein